MCRCNPVNIAKRYCGKQRVFQPATPKGGVRPPVTSLGFCRHPDFGREGATLPASVDPKTGAWFEHHAREHDPPQPQTIHPKVAEVHLGFEIGHLAQLAVDLKAARDGRGATVRFPFSLATIANTAQLAAQQAAVTMNSGREQSTGHHQRTVVKLQSIQRGLQRVHDVIHADEPASPETLNQLAHLVEKYLLPKAVEVLRDMHAVPPDWIGAHGFASPLPPGEPV
jgi:hypothetical protein